MSLKSVLKSIFSSSAAKSIEAFAFNELDKAIVAAKQTEIGAAALKAIAIVETPGATALQKIEGAIAIVAPVVVDYIGRGGFPAVIADAEAFARAVIESTLADTKQTKAVSIGKAILKLLGLAS